MLFWFHSFKVKNTGEMKCNTYFVLSTWKLLAVYIYALLSVVMMAALAMVVCLMCTTYVGVIWTPI